MSGEMNSSFFVQLPTGFFTQFGKQLSSLMISQNASIPFKDNPQFPLLVDILSRKDWHHAHIHFDLMPQFHVYFLEAFLQHLAAEHIPPQLREAELIYIDITQNGFPKNKIKSIERDFENIWEVLDRSEKYLLFAIPAQLLLTHATDDSDEVFLRNQFLNLMTHPKCRILLLGQQSTNQLPGFVSISVQGLNETEVMTILKLQRAELEHFHNVIIPEDLLSHAYSLTERYLSTTNTLEKALLLLDSSAARTCTSSQSETSNQFKPVMTHTILTNVLSTWTQIPASHLHIHKFKAFDFIQHMQQKTYGQDEAIAVLAKELQRLQSGLEKSNKPLASFIFAGPKHAGKDMLAIALADQLYKQPNVLYFSQPGAHTLTSIANLKVKRRSDKHYSLLKDAIRSTPYAMLAIDNLDSLPAIVLDELVEITSSGYLHDGNGNELNFSHTILLLYTAYGTNRLLELSQEAIEADNDNNGSDLLQLVMNEQRHKPNSRQEYTADEFVAALLPELATLLPPALLQHTQVVPFLPLDKLAIEKIANLRLKQLSKTLETRHGIEFGYAPEVVRYLINQVLHNQEVDQQNLDVETALKPLYSTIEQAIASQVDNKNRPNQLFLQLNETGQLLRCDWLTMSALRA